MQKKKRTEGFLSGETPCPQFSVSSFPAVLYHFVFCQEIPDTTRISEGAQPRSARDTTIFTAHRTISLISTS